MKIDEVLSGQAAQETKKAGGAHGAGGDDAFALMLQSEMEGQGREISADTALPGVDSLSGLLGVQSSVRNSTQAPELSGAISALDGVLTQFDSLSNALLQQSTSPKEIDALIQGINTQVAGLDDKISGLPAGHQLRDMAEELKVSAYMESVKWKRGDYL